MSYMYEVTAVNVRSGLKKFHTKLMEIFSCKSSVEQLSGYFLKPKNKDACIVHMYTTCIRQHLHTVNHHFMLKDIIHKNKSLSIYTLINCCIYVHVLCACAPRCLCDVCIAK